MCVKKRGGQCVGNGIGGICGGKGGWIGSDK